jgi:hypothetical protein
MHKYPRTLAAIAAASLLATFAAQANKGADYKPHHHKEHHKNFFITGGATYLEPSNNGLDYLTVTTPTTDSVSSYTEALQPEFNWGYYLAAGYRISHHYDVQADWAQFNSSLSDSTTVSGAPDTVFTTSNGASSILAAGTTATADSKQTIDYSVFNATLGQYHDITEMLRTRLFAGIQYAKVDSDVHNTYTTPPAIRRQSVSYDDYNSTFSGVGPEIGLDLEYKIWHKFGVVSHFAAAFLIGQQDTDSYVSTPTTRGQAAINTESVTRMVPALDARLGLNWNVPYEYQKCSFGIEAGYEIAYLFDVIDQAGSTGNNYSNYGNMGPYLNLTAMF